MDRQVDLALIEGAVSYPDLKVVPFDEDELFLLVRPDDPLVGPDTVDFDALRGRPFVWREPGSGTRALGEQTFAGSRESLPTGLMLDSPEAINRAVEVGPGLAIQSRLIAQDSLAANRLRALRIPGRPMVRHLWLVALRGRVASPAAALFRGLVRQPESV